MAILERGDHTNGVGWAMRANQKVMRNSKNLSQEKERKPGSMEKVGLDPEACEMEGCNGGTIRPLLGGAECVHSKSEVTVVEMRMLLSCPARTLVSCKYSPF